MRRSHRPKLNVAVALVAALSLFGCDAPEDGNRGEPSAASVTVQVSSPPVETADLNVVAERFNYASELLTLFIREREGLRATVGTLFVPLDTALATALASQQRSLADLNSPSRYNLLLLRAHASNARLAFAELADGVGQKIRLLSGTEVTIVTDPASGGLFLERADGSRIKIIATDVFTGDLVVHFVDQPVSLPFGS